MGLTDWSVTAANLPEHAENIIHTDAGAQAAGYDAALVAGVTTYAYLTHVPATAWGLDWLVRGGASMRFVRPVVDGDAVECAVGEADTDPCIVEARVADIVHATAEFTRHATQIDQRSGDELEPSEFVIDTSWADYGQRGGGGVRWCSRHRGLLPLCGQF